MKKAEKKPNILVRVFLRTGVAVKYVFTTTGKGIKIAWQRHHFLIPPKMWKEYAKKLKDRTVYKFKYGMNSPHFNPFDKEEYGHWVKMHRNDDLAVEKLAYEPLISIVIPVYNIEPQLLKECLDSILAQTYTKFEICLADDASTNQETLETLRVYEQKDARVRVVYRKKNGHIAKATNSALKIAQGEFVAFMDNDDTLAKNALYEVANILNQDKKIDLIYSDEDKIDLDGKFCDPHFKPDFSPDTLLGVNYICHLCVMRKKILDEIGGLDDKYVGAQDYGLVLRFVEKTKHIYHIPKVLYHWRKIPGSTAATIDSKSYAIGNGRKAVEAALKRRGIKGKVLEIPGSSLHVVEYDTPGDPLVSIIIPTKNGVEVLKKCVDSIYTKTTYKNYEVIVVDNQSDELETLDLLKKYQQKHQNFSVVKADFPFNYSKINNLAVKKAKGEYIVLLNNDTEIITERWLDILLGYAIQKHVGAVGAKLLYPDMTIQHGGIILGLGGVAGHAYIGAEREAEGHYGRLMIPYDYGGVTAACLMVKKSKFNKVGGLEEKLQVAFNDVDFNMKLLEAGYYNVFVPQVELVHYESKTRGAEDTPEKFKRFTKECEFMEKKWGEKLRDGRFYNPNYSMSRDFYLDAKK